MPHISTGSVSLDYLIGGKENAQGVRPCPGIPRGRITNIMGLQVQVRPPSLSKRRLNL